MDILKNILSQQIIQNLGWTLVHFVWQAAAVALLLAILFRLLRKSSSNLRYIIACIALALIVLMPIVTIRLPDVPAETIEPVKLAPIDLPKAGFDAPPIVQTPPIETTPPLLPAAAPKIPLKDKFVEAIDSSLPFIVVAWLVGVFCLSIWHLGGWAQLQRLRRKMVKQVSERVNLRLKYLAEKLGIKRTIEIAESALVQVPAVVGWLRPVILLPATALTGLTAWQLEAILAHELAHIKRCDYLVNILQTAVEILGFYHPAVWWVSHKIRAERENCCDDLAVSVSGDRVGYARALTSMEQVRTGYTLAVAADGGGLFDRIRRLLTKDHPNQTKISWLPSAIAIMLIASLLIPVCFAMSGRLNPESETAAQEEQKQLSEFKADLPNGVTVELVGVYHGYDVNNLEIWRPDGSLMSSQESESFRKRVLFPEWGNKEFKFEYGLIVKFSPLDDLHTDLFVRQGQRMNYSYPKSEGIAVALTASDKYDREQGFSKVGNIQVAAARGPWNTRKFSARINEPVTREFDENSNIMFSSLRMTDKWLLDITLNAANIDFDCFYELKDGSIHGARYDGTMSHPSWIGPNQRTPMITKNYALSHEPEKIANYIVKFRKFEIVEFKNISLKPNFKTDAQVEGKGKNVQATKLTSSFTRDGILKIWQDQERRLHDIYINFDFEETIKGINGKVKASKRENIMYMSKGNLFRTRKQVFVPKGSNHVANDWEFSADGMRKYYCNRTGSHPHGTVENSLPEQAGIKDNWVVHYLSSVYRMPRKKGNAGHECNLIGALEEAKTIEVTEELFEGRKAVVLNRPNYSKVYLDPMRNLAVLGSEATGDLTFKCRNSNFVEVAEGIWMPLQTERTFKQGSDLVIRKTKVKKLKVNNNYTKEDFKIKFEPGIRVRDINLKPHVQVEAENLSREIDDNTENPEFKAALPNGVTVELIGVCEHPSEGKQWWSPEGLLLKEAPYDKIQETPFILEQLFSGMTGNLQRIELALRVITPTETPPKVGWRMESTGHIYYMEKILKDGRIAPQLKAFVAAVSSEDKTIEVKLSINGSWIRFKNIALKPNLKTNVQIEVGKSGVQVEKKKNESAARLRDEELRQRSESLKKLRGLGLMLIMYADVHDERYPYGLELIKRYDDKDEVVSWALENVGYLGRGRSAAVEPQALIAYDKTMLLEKGCTNLLFNDSHVEFCEKKRVKDAKFGGIGLLDIENRWNSAQNLSDLGKCMLIFACNHDDRYPQSLDELSKADWFGKAELDWLKENIEYLGYKEKPTSRPAAVLAYDKTLMEKGEGTNVLYNDCRVKFEKPENLKKLGITTEIKPAVEVETKEPWWSISTDDANIPITVREITNPEGSVEVAERVVSGEAKVTDNEVSDGFGRVEGRCFIGNSPAANKTICIYPFTFNDSVKTQKEFKATTDSDGDFAFESVPAGWVKIGRQAKMGKSAWSITSRIATEIKPGETTNVTIGGVGRPVVGRCVTPQSYDKRIDYGFGTRLLTSHRDDPPYPANFEQMTKRQQTKWGNEWAQSKEGRASFRNYQLKEKTFAFKLNDDGSFRIDDVPAGKYDILIWIEDSRFNEEGLPEEIASYHSIIDVPDFPGRRTDEPFNLGDLELKMQERLNIGDSAPQLELETLAGRNIKVSDFRGKHLLLSFYSTSFYPVRSKLLDEIYQGYGRDGRLVMIGFVGNDTLEQVKQYAKEQNFKWPQVYLEDYYNNPVVKAYGAWEISFMFFIGPDGKLISKHLVGQNLKETISQHLGQPLEYKTSVDLKSEKEVSKKDEVEITARFLLLPVDANEITGFFEDKSFEDALVKTYRHPDLKCYSLNDKQVEQLLMLSNTNPDSKLLTSPEVVVKDWEDATMRLQKTIRYTDNSANSNESEVKELKVGKIFRVTPRLEEGGRIISLDFKLEHTSLIEFDEDNLPRRETNEIASRISVPNGGTLLLGGQKITDNQNGQKVQKVLWYLIKAAKLEPDNSPLNN